MNGTYSAFTEGAMAALLATAAVSSRATAAPAVGAAAIGSQRVQVGTAGL